MIKKVKLLHQPLNLLSLGTLGLIGLTTVALLVDSFGNPHTFARFFSVDSEALILPALLLSVLTRLKEKVFFPPFLEKCSNAILFALLPVTVIASFYDSLVYDNAFFAFTRFHQSALWELTLFFSALYFITKNNAWWRVHWKKFLLFLPIYSWFLFFLASFLPFDFLAHLAGEDNVIEYLQFFLLASGVMAASIGVYRAGMSKNLKLGLFLFLVAITFIFLAGEEISWGQRIFDLQPTEALRERNRQGEYTLHNLEEIHDQVIYLYIVVSLSGTIGVALTKISREKNPFTKFLPQPYLIGFFIFPLCFYLLQLGGGIFHIWAEVMELFLHTALTLWILTLVRELFGISKETQSTHS